ncbi:uncharacterized protein LOC121980166 [Zingiber officinale]|uniref:uncharacterized protein LOC121980166 n=1 Tax=Zingiber officinale TaxID=94328 RepID=UPI001C4CB7B1|nr:uncharacterized protein LOC121980166 [Zingiber officinale]
MGPAELSSIRHQLALKEKALRDMTLSRDLQTSLRREMEELWQAAKYRTRAEIALKMKAQIKHEGELASLKEENRLKDETICQLQHTLESTITGDLFDCVDMYKQPAFDHPLLKNHTLQLKPSSFPKGMKLGKSKSASFYGFNDTCPSGTVLVHRARKQDLTKSQLLRNQFRAQAIIANEPTADQNHFAIIENAHGPFYGAYAKMATYKLPDLKANQTSSSTIYLLGNPHVPNNEINVIEAGWQVSTALYDSSYPRFFTFWTSDGHEKTGCPNLDCPGFISTTNIYGPGSFIPEFSIYGGEQKYLSILIARDSQTGNWWVTYNNQLPLGYFPKELLPKMQDHASVIQMGGHVNSPLSVPSPPMGSGHSSNEGWNKAAYFIQVQLVTRSNNLIRLNPVFTFTTCDISDYYCVSDKHYTYDENVYVFAYGGVGGFKK